MNPLDGVLIIGLISLSLYTGYQIIQYLLHKKALSVGGGNIKIKKNGCLEGILYLSKVGGVLFILGFISLICLSKYMDSYYHTSPKDSYYTEMLEKIVGQPLPSCKVLAKDYMRDTYENIIFQMNPEDYEKVYQAFEADKDFISSTPEKLPFIPIGGLLKQNSINHEAIEKRYFGFGQWGLKPPDIVIFQHHLE